MTATVHPISERIEGPQFHAARLHALFVSAVCVDDTSLVMDDVEKDDIRSCLINMAREESCRLRISLLQGSPARSPVRYTASTGQLAPVSVPGLFFVPMVSTADSSLA
jgi:hypothetical protein